MEYRASHKYARISGQKGERPESFLIMPEGVSDKLLGKIRECGVTPKTIDTSETRRQHHR